MTLSPSMRLCLSSCVVLVSALVSSVSSSVSSLKYLSCSSVRLLSSSKIVRKVGLKLFVKFLLSSGLVKSLNGILVWYVLQVQSSRPLVVEPLVQHLWLSCSTLLLLPLRMHKDVSYLVLSVTTSCVRLVR